MALLLKTASPHAALWRSELARLAPGLETRLFPELGKPGEVEIALVWAPPRGLLASLPALKLIISLGAGVDHLLADPDLPRDVPIMRLVDPHMIGEMSEYLMLQILRLHRQDPTYAAQQRQRVWREHVQPPASARRIGILGLGRYGADAAAKLAGLGFDVAGWSRRPKAVAGIRCFDGKAGFDALLRRTDILVCLLPLTHETADILDGRAFALMPRGGAIVNVGRGGHLVEGDLLAALDSGQLGAAILDVVREEPLPAAHPIWRHPRIILTPHVAAATNPLTAAPIVADAIHRLRAGRPIPDLVDRDREY
ncbi:MAG: glyoxylate/hydroxypyruvate reductase A [Alphaproteobacteria bacterium]|nr:glyoxylate/hydroxypyruvate reductase A [Alphaproteobacteria bacterium]